MMATLFPIPNDFNTQRSELWLEAASDLNALLNFDRTFIRTYTYIFHLS